MSVTELGCGTGYYGFYFSDEVKPVRRPSNLQICRHLWRASIPSNLPVGEHRIEVQATDMFGRVFTQNSSYQIKELPK